MPISGLRIVRKNAPILSESINGLHRSKPSVQQNV
jgi:hypothetical protein